MDILNRQPFIDDIKTIVKLYSEKKRNVTFAINGKWGSGKTFILKMLEEQLKNDYIVFHYNAWEYDYYDEPLIALITSTINSLGDYIEVDKTTKQIGNSVLENAKSVLVRILGEILKTTPNIDLSDYFKSNAAKMEFLTEYNKLNTCSNLDEAVVFSEQLLASAKEKKN